MTNFEQYLSSFFKNLEIYEDINNNKDYKCEIFSSIHKFLNKSTPENAYAVYETFFKAYWIGTQRNENPFLKLTEKMKQFEELAGKLTSKQRDHYVHSIFVFLLGLVVYEQNKYFRKTFDLYALDKQKYFDCYDTKHEEFFYRWGLASLFHDIAYPLEITLKQASLYTDFICDYPEKKENKLGIKMELYNFEDFIELPTIEPSPSYKCEFLKKYPNYKQHFHSDAIAILSESISSNFNLNFNDINKNIRKYVEDMHSKSLIDHGFYSAVIMLHWYHYLVRETNWNPSYFYYPISDASCAIFLHNFFEYGLMNSFDLDPLNPETHPIGYLLILCDQLQEWNRQCYGTNALDNEYPCDFELVVDDDKMEITYKYSENCENSQHCGINGNIYKLLRTDSLFKLGVFVK